jgi:nitrogen-specific signal transduction histidine kinase
VSTCVALAGADHHEDLLRRMFPVRTERAGARADAALHAHLDHVAPFDIALDFAQEVRLVALDGVAVPL